MKDSVVFERLSAGGDAPAMIHDGGAISFAQLWERVQETEASLSALEPGTVVAILGGWTPGSVATLLAGIRCELICVPQVRADARIQKELREIAEVEVIALLGDDDRLTARRTGRQAWNPLYRELQERGVPGLVLFSSGSTGTPKGMVHDFSLHLERHRATRRALSTLAFLGFDHMGGLNTLLYCLASGATLVTTMDRRPEAVLDVVERHGVQLLPTSPTFLNLALLGSHFDGRDLSALRLVTYGSEPMLPSVLERLARTLPEVELKQTYGLSELGVMASRSRGPDSPWMKLGGEGYQTRVRDGLLEIKARTAMLGYLNAESPFTDDGWFMTGDAVLVEDGWFQVLGRRSELIFVGGEKVYPAEVESVIQEIDGVLEVAVHGETSPIMGQVVAARVRVEPGRDESRAELSRRIKHHCASRLERWKIPTRIELAGEPLHGARMKKLRCGHA